MTEKKDYVAFDRFIKAKIKEGTIRVDMSEHQLKEVLRQLGIRRVATTHEGRRYVNNAYPKESQINHVKEVLGREPQQKIDKSMFYDKFSHGIRAKEIIFYNNKTYRKGQFLPKRYKDE